MSGDFDIFQPVLVGLDNDVGGDGVAGLEFIERGRRLDGVGHGHWVHKAGDGVVVDAGVSCLFVYGNYFAFEGIALGPGLGVGGGWRGSAVAGDGESEQEAQREERGRQR